MKDDPLEETRACWDALAADWRVQVGDEGDSNRRLNSDPTLWEFAGDVRGLAVLDAGCGTGYLSRKLHERGAVVTGVDLSPNMIELARAHYPGLDFLVMSCGDLAGLEDGRFDLVVSNYVLMDTPELEATVLEFARVLKPGGAAVLVFSHPCFPQSRADVANGGEKNRYTWDFPYFDRGRVTDPPWAHFRAEFIWFHRPLSDYWKAFAAAGFLVERFEEPRVHPDRHHLAESERVLRKSQARPYSVAFRLVKAAACRPTPAG